MPARQHLLAVYRTLDLIAQVSERAVARVERQPRLHQGLRQHCIASFQRLASLLGKRAGQSRIAEQAVLRVDPANGGERRADVLRTLRIDEKPALQVVVEPVAEALDLVVLARAETIREVFHRERVRKEGLQFSKQQVRARVVRIGLIRLGRGIDATLECLDETGPARLR